MSLSTAEAAVLAKPDDEGAWQVYADALQAAGDPRGELMAVQMKLATSGADGAAMERERALIAQHAEQWLFPGAAPLLQKTRLSSGEGVPLDITWKRGFPSRVLIQSPRYNSNVKFEGLGDTWRALNGTRSNAQFVRTLNFGSMEPGDEADWTDSVNAVREFTPPWLRSLSFERGDYWDISSTFIWGLDAGFWQSVPKLESLHLEIGEIGLSAIDAPALKRFSLMSSGFDGELVVELTRAKWPQLEHLSVHVGDPNYGGLDELSQLEPLLISERPPKLTHLGLCNAVFADELPKRLLTCNWLPHLESLDLSDGTLGDEGAEVLCANAEKFAHLKKLNLSRGYFSDSFVDLLRSKFPNVVLEDLQGEAERDDRYVAVSE